MGAFTRIPADTFQQIQTNAGILLYKFDPENPQVDDNDIVCPTTGGVTIRCVPTTSDQGEDVDNCPANLLELKQIDSWDCGLEFTSLGTTAKSIRLAMGAADIDSEDPSFSVPEGYHNGKGVVKILPELKTAAPSKTAQTIEPSQGKVLAAVTVEAIPAQFVDTGDATAAAAHILAGKTAYAKRQQPEPGYLRHDPDHYRNPGRGRGHFRPLQ